MSPHDHQPCWLISVTGSYLTPFGTFSDNPAEALIAERWYLQRQQSRLPVATLIIRAIITKTHAKARADQNLANPSRTPNS
jgi:hypothetical protein